MPTFSNLQLQQLLAAIDLQSPQGYRDYTIVLTLVDTALRASELTGIRMDDLRLNEGLIRVLGKGRKERIVPIGRQLQRVIWRYVERYRLQPITLLMMAPPLGIPCHEVYIKDFASANLRNVDDKR